MTGNEYQEICMRTTSPISRATSDNLLLQGVMGMCGEAGEAIDIVKKIIMQGHPFDDAAKEHLAYEIGDVLWYAATASYALGYDFDDIMRMNTEKLKKRYPDGFKSENSLHRKDGDI